MSDDLSRALADAVRAKLPPDALRTMHAVQVVDQDSNGRVGVRIPSGSPAPDAKPVEAFYGLPGWAAKFKSNAKALLGFREGAEDGAYVNGYPHYPQGSPGGEAPTPEPLPIEYLSFGGGTQPVARVDDTVDAGAIVFRHAPVGPGGVPSVLAISYRMPGNGPELPILAITIPGPAVVLSPDPNDPTAAVVKLDQAKITSGREELRA